MSLTSGQRAQTCASCASDQSAAPGRYCPRFACVCGHEACPAFASYVPRRSHIDVPYFTPPTLALVQRDTAEEPD